MIFWLWHFKFFSDPNPIHSKRGLRRFVKSSHPAICPVAWNRLINKDDSGLWGKPSRLLPPQVISFHCTIIQIHRSAGSRWKAAVGPLIPDPDCCGGSWYHQKFPVSLLSLHQPKNTCQAISTQSTGGSLNRRGNALGALGAWLPAAHLIPIAHPWLLQAQSSDSGLGKSAGSSRSRT